MTNKIISCFLIFIIFSIPAQVHAQELKGTVTSLIINEKAPYAGILLDPIAASKMIVDQKYLKIEIELELRKEFQKNLAEKRMAYDILKISYDSLEKIHEQTLLLREEQINNLNLMLKEEMKPDHSEWWAIGGLVAGIALSIAVFYASVEIAK